MTLDRERDSLVSWRQSDQILCKLNPQIKDLQIQTLGFNDDIVLKAFARALLYFVSSSKSLCRTARVTSSALKDTVPKAIFLLPSHNLVAITLKTNINITLFTNTYNQLNE